MKTRIYVSGKIKKAYKKLELEPLPEKDELDNHENSWNAHYMNIDSKKCWILTHTKTRYTVFIPEVNVSKLNDLRHWFLDQMINQIFKSRNIDLTEFDPDRIEEFVGEFEFYPTNNNKSCISYINKRIEELEYWKYDYYHNYDLMPFYKLGALSNELGSMLRNGKSEYIRPTKEILELINVSA